MYSGIASLLSPSTLTIDLGFASVNNQRLGDNKLAIPSYPVNKYILLYCIVLYFNYIKKAINLSSFKHGFDFMEIREGNKHLDVICIFTDFKAKRIKSKIHKYKINRNNTITKHEFKVKSEGY